MAVNPSLQGRGYGKKLFNFLSELVDADGCSAYLECCGERNTAFYSKFGYEVVESVLLEVPEPRVVLPEPKDSEGNWKTGGAYISIMVRPPSK